MLRDGVERLTPSVKIVIDVSYVDVQAAKRCIDVHAALNEQVYKGSKIAGRVERERVGGVGHEPRFVVDLAAGMKQVDVHPEGSVSAALALGRTATRVAQFDALDV